LGGGVGLGYCNPRITLTIRDFWRPYKEISLLDQNFYAFKKWRPDHFILYATSFKRVFLDIIRINIPNLKAEKKWESPKEDSMANDKELKAKTIIRGQNIASSQGEGKYRAKSSTEK